MYAVNLLFRIFYMSLNDDVFISLLNIFITVEAIFC